MAPALTSEVCAHTTAKIPTSPPLADSVETTVVSGRNRRLKQFGEPQSLKEVLHKQLLSSNFGIFTQPTLLSSSFGTNAKSQLPDERHLLTLQSAPLTMNYTQRCDNNSDSLLSKKSVVPASSSGMGLLRADHKSACASKPLGVTNTSNGINSLHHNNATPSTSAIPQRSTEPARVPTISHSPVQSLETVTMACDSRQKELHTRAERLHKRLRRLQSRQAISHVRQQMAGLVDYQKNTLHLQLKTEDGKSGMLRDKDVKNMSTSALVNLVQTWQSRHSQIAQQTPANEADSHRKLDEELCVELDRVSGNLQTNLRHLEQAVDSDATDSSSGGESCDDMDYDDWDGKTPRPPLTQRAEWIWTQERSRIVSRWTWLQAQVSDLEYRIRQQNDIYRQIRQNKGMIVLGDSSLTTDKNAVVASPCNVTEVLSNVNKQSKHLTKQLGNVYSPAAPSTIGSPVTSDTPNGLVQDAAGADTSCVAARCCPVKLPQHRRLLRTVGLHQQKRRASRLSTVRCCCYPPRPPCAMCGGRYNNTQSLNPVTMLVPERIALLDPAYHPVLSFQQDAPLALHFEALLKTGEWQQQKNASFTKLMQIGNRQKLHAKDKPRKYNKHIKKNSSTAMLNRIKNKYDQKGMCRPASLPAQKKSESNSRLCLKIRKRKSGLFNSGSGNHKRSRLSNSRMSTRSADLSRDSSTFRDMKDALKKRRSESAFDINNIVIPYSIAASTRVEKLQYKEIATPKWRELSDSEPTSQPCKVVIKSPPPHTDTTQTLVQQDTTTASKDKNGLIVVRAVVEADEEIENLSDDVFTKRHYTCEITERKKFRTYQTAQRRGRGHRTDSTTESSDPHPIDSLPPASPPPLPEQFDTYMICPWPQRKFPMSSEDFECMLQSGEQQQQKKPLEQILMLPATPSPPPPSQTLLQQQQHPANQLADQWTVDDSEEAASKLVLKLTKR